MLESHYGLVKHIYFTLTSIYAATFRTKSPTFFDWREEDVWEMLGGDQELIEKFGLVKTEMLWLC